MWEKLSDFIPRLRWVVLLIVLTLGFAVTQIPATWGAYLMTQGNTVGMTGVNGTLWQGRASMTSVEIDGIQYSLGELRWQLDPASVLTLRPCANVVSELERQRIEGQVCARTNGTIRVTNASIDAPASLIQAGLPVPVDGQLAATISSLALQGEHLRELQGRLSWTNARVQTEGNWTSLGSYASEFQYNGRDAIVAQVFNLNGPVELDGTVTLALVGGVDIQGQMTLSPAFSDEIQAEEWMPMVLESPERYRYRLDLQL
ncbi:type II secretion system protein N [Marinimicrobium sp. ABcell2]|uniref:type II secretion system protein N n=1 Tax=Marinimicrobium sp. ABcell2 TaxID=3069751 RepID=UPI0027B7D6A1|nr:type II secretion system protein N [Marinimicrobium sp. ABcell2]MDQ2076653.1 type II secretion system protein N [Marinimicrobium sp. ABcell2]